MNPYLSREEKSNYVRTTALVELLETTIDGYTKARSVDKKFLKFLRMGRTLIRKAVLMRSAALTEEAKDDFYKQANRLEFICIPKLEARKAFDEILKLQTTLPMEMHDFEDWYEEVIEVTCKTCRRPDWTVCKMRRVLHKYGVYPIDPSALGKCQYSYAEGYADPCDPFR